MLKGDATITYEDPHAAASAPGWFDGKEFKGACALRGGEGREGIMCGMRAAHRPPRPAPGLLSGARPTPASCASYLQAISCT